jgi:hypothetical protein
MSTGDNSKERVRSRQIARKIDMEKLNAIHEMEKQIAKAVEVAKRYGINRKSVVSLVNDYFE